MYWCEFFNFKINFSPNLMIKITSINRLLLNFQQVGGIPPEAFVKWDDDDDEEEEAGTKSQSLLSTWTTKKYFEIRNNDCASQFFLNI